VGKGLVFSRIESIVPSYSRYLFKAAWTVRTSRHGEGRGELCAGVLACWYSDLSCANTVGDQTQSNTESA